MVKDNPFLVAYEQLERSAAAAGVPAWVAELRRAGFERFAEAGLPTTRLEDWKYTNAAPVARTRFALAQGTEVLPADELERFAFPELKGSELVFVNGRYAPELSSVASLPDGVLLTSLDRALRLDPECVRAYLGRHASFEDPAHAFTALNAAFLRDGAFLYVPGGLILSEPIHLLHVLLPDAEGGEAPLAVHPRNVLVLQRGSQATVIESYAGVGAGAYLTNAVTEVVLCDGAVLHHCKLQRETREGYHVARTEVHQERDAHLHSMSLSLGGALVRNDLATTLDGPGAGCTLDGLYLAAGRQHVDNHTRVDHAKPHCTSHELYKGILTGAASAVFNGKAIVRKDAQKTDAHQTNRNLLLSESAVIDTKPELEIYADDVRCTHGATIGQLDQDSLFYLRSRGLDLASARALLIWAFASEIVERIHVPTIRARLEPAILEWFEASQGETTR